ncbi:hypothetical protein E2P81_ATG08040 [Venturia nashicola]|nr:hypothetical protein E2P81_ATG08040 [Venturia nashicola]
MSRSRSVRRDKLRRSVSVQERNGLTRTGSPWSPISPIFPTRYSAPSSPIEYPVHLSFDEISSKSCAIDQNWPLTVPRLTIPTPGPRQTGQCTNIYLQIPGHTSDDYALSPASPCAYTPLANDLKFFTAIPNPSSDKKPTSQLSETTLVEDTIPKSLNSLSKKGVKRTASTRAKGHKRGKTPPSKILPEVHKAQVQNPEVLSRSEVDDRSESPSFSSDHTNARQRKDSLGSLLCPARSVSGRGKDGNFLPVRAPTLSILQPLTEEPTALERKKMPLVTTIVPPPVPGKITKIIGPVRRISTRRRCRMEAMQKPLPSALVEDPPRETRSPSPSTKFEAEFTSITQVIYRTMSPAEFEEANTSPSFPSSSFGPKPTSPWSQLFKRAKNPSPREEISGSQLFKRAKSASPREEKSGFLGKFRGKAKEKKGDGDEDGKRERRRGELRGKIRVVETLNMNSAFED